jgi:short-chain Z-isoprenyl diphosphate synthase
MVSAKSFLYSLYERRLLREIGKGAVPQHIGVILDGHRRFARAEGLPDYQASYRVGMALFEEFLEWAQQPKIPAITAWVLSPQNLNRPADELEPYFDVLIELFERLPKLAEQYDMGVRVIGRLDHLPARLTKAAEALEAACPDGSTRVSIAMGYGGREEIVDAARELVGDLVEQGLSGGALIEAITPESLGANMYTADVPDADLLIRTSGESRLSGFLMWQSAYSEFAFVDVFWPEFRRVDYLRTLRDFGRRDRRFGQ